MDMSVPRLSQNRTLVNLSNAFLKYFGIAGPHPDYFPEVEDILFKDQNKGKKIVFFLIEGLGKQQLNAFKRKASFLYNNQYINMDSVYPSISLTNFISFLYGKYPAETGWIGSVQYFQRVHQYIDMESGVIHGTNASSGINPKDFLKRETIIDLLNAKYAQDIAYFIDGRNERNNQGLPSVGKFFIHIEEKIHLQGSRFVFALWPHFKEAMDMKGRYNGEDAIDALSRCLEAFVIRNPDTIVLFSGDHGLLKTEWIDITRFKDFTDCLVEPRLSIEGRFASFLVKGESFSLFEKTFRDHFARDFELYTKEQLYRENIFGYGSQFTLFDEFIGNYVLIAKGRKSLTDGTMRTDVKYVSGGATDKERIFPLGILNVTK